MTENIRKLCEEALELDGKATPGPWRYAQLLDELEARALLDAKGYHFGQADDLENGALIAHYRQSCPTIARALLIALDALEAMEDFEHWNAHVYHKTYSEGTHKAREALAQIQKLVEGER